MTTRDFARFGLLYLRGGEWDGAQLIPRSWVDESRVPAPTNPEYGLQWWLFEDGGAFSAEGLFGQRIVVVPEHDLVIAVNTTSGGDPVDDGRRDPAAVRRLIAQGASSRTSTSTTCGPASTRSSVSSKRPPVSSGADQADEHHVVAAGSRTGRRRRPATGTSSSGVIVDSPPAPRRGVQLDRRSDVGIDAGADERVVLGAARA